MKGKNSSWSRLNTQTLVSNGWEKIGGSSYKKGGNIIIYTGTHWLYNGEELTEDNYEEKIGIKKSRKNRI